MNLRNTFITLGIVLAVLALGIAYAAMNSQTLNVVGNVATTTDDANLRVYFVEEDGISPIWTNLNGAEAEVSAEILDDHNAKFSISGLDAAGDIVNLRFKVACESQADVAAMVRASLVENFDEEWFRVSADVIGADYEYWEDDERWQIFGNQDTGNVIVSVELLKTPITDEDIEASTGDFYINFEAVPTRYDPSLWSSGEG